jgi:hypothetical protein
VGNVTRTVRSHPKQSNVQSLKPKLAGRAKAITIPALHAGQRRASMWLMLAIDDLLESDIKKRSHDKAGALPSSLSPINCQFYRAVMHHNVDWTVRFRTMGLFAPNLESDEFATARSQ